MNIARQEEHENELAIFLSRHEGGLQALRAWLFMRRDKINGDWPVQVGDDLIRLQGEAKTVARLIKLIDIGPSITKLTGVA